MLLSYRAAILFTAWGTLYKHIVQHVSSLDRVHACVDTSDEYRAAKLKRMPSMQLTTCMLVTTALGQRLDR